MPLARKLEYGNFQNLKYSGIKHKNLNSYKIKPSSKYLPNRVSWQTQAKNRMPLARKLEYGNFLNLIGKHLQKTAGL
jgi:hypothetical protein